MNNKLLCPLCNDTVDKLLYRFHVENERVVLKLIKEKNPSWSTHDGLCSRCVDYYHTQLVLQQKILPEIGPHFPVKSADDFVILPTALRLDADPRFTGKGITICFIDSGFFLHDDLVKTSNRVKKAIDITNLKNDDSFFMKADPSAWHGTMTSVVAAGDGYSSRGLYKGIASDAELVLLKVQNDAGSITDENICRALQWVLDNHRQYEIRIVNISLGADEALSYKKSAIDALAEKLIKAGIHIVAAVGNNEAAAVKPPANAPYVIAVGGIDDNNLINNEQPQAYHSSYTVAADGVSKPELVANAVWVAAPILPGTPEKENAEQLHLLLAMGDEILQATDNKILEETGADGGSSTAGRRDALVGRIQSTKFFSPHYMHVDGTSFAAPIVSSVIAQLLEINASLTPAQVRQVLFSTARRFERIETVRQGFGYIQPRKAVLKVLKNEVIMKTHESPYINKRKKMIEFHIQNSCAGNICLAGSFNHWAHDVLLLEANKNGLWKIEIPMLPKGRYQYKFFIDDRMWVEDVENPLREHDGFNGWNSILEIK
ncbi:MAG: S8 family serine peptidase [Ferruginibacter sp.]